MLFTTRKSSLLLLVGEVMNPFLHAKLRKRRIEQQAIKEEAFRKRCSTTTTKKSEDVPKLTNVSTASNSSSSGSVGSRDASN